MRYVVAIIMALVVAGSVGYALHMTEGNPLCLWGLGALLFPAMAMAGESSSTSSDELGDGT